MTDICFGRSRQEGYLINTRFKAILEKIKVALLSYVTTM